MWVFIPFPPSARLPRQKTARKDGMGGGVKKGRGRGKVINGRGWNYARRVGDINSGLKTIVLFSVIIISTFSSHCSAGIFSSNI